MKKIATKILIIFMIISCIILTGSYNTKASFWEKVQTQANNFITHGSEGTTDLTGGAQETVNGIGRVLTTIGLVVILVGFLILGIKYMVASSEEAAKIKKQIVGLAISSIVLFGAYTIWRLVGTTLERIF